MSEPTPMAYIGPKTERINPGQTGDLGGRHGNLRRFYPHGQTTGVTVKEADLWDGKYDGPKTYKRLNRHHG